MDKGIKKLKTKYIYGLSFIIPIIILALIYSFIGLCPIGNKVLPLEICIYSMLVFLQNLEIYSMEMEV